MELITLEKQKMDILSEIATTNMKISEAKNLLTTLQEKETEYLIIREKKALTKITKVLEESKDLLDKTHQNYEHIHEFCKTLSGYADFLDETHEKFSKMLETFAKRNEIWDENAKRQYEEIARQRKIVEQDAEAVAKRETKIIETKKGLIREREQIESRQQALLIAYKTEKDLWDKLNK